MKSVCTGLVTLSGVLFCLGYLGSLHPFFDAIAIGRWVALFSLVVFLFLRVLFVRDAGSAILFLGALALTAAVSQTPDTDETGDVRVYTKNLWHANPQVDAVVSDIQDADPDLVFLQEVSDTNMDIMDGLEAALPYQALCPWQGWNGVAILSRWPFSDDVPRCSPQRSLMAMRVDRPDGPFWAVGVHLQQPWPDVQWAHLEEALPVLANLDAGAIVAGDFNTVPWSAAALEIGESTGTSPVGPRRATFHLFGVPLALDQIWASGGQAKIRPALGSDHLGVVADVTISFPAKTR